MQTKKVQCPSCGQVLEVRNPNNETLKKFTCPKCNALLQARFTPQQEPLEAKTYLGPKQAVVNNGSTQLSGSNFGSTHLVVSKDSINKNALLEANGHTYPLQEGENTVGRKCSSSKAMVQIDATDNYMSRQHFIINVSTLPDGSKKVVLRNYQNKNRTYINGQPIEKGDEIRLFDGNKIKIGNTIITFKLS